MIDVDTSKFAPDIINLLMLRSAAVPKLQWHSNPAPAAKDILDGTQDDKILFRRERLADEGMCAAVRALLYFWNGWPSESAMYAQAAPERERLFISAMLERQAGHPAESKSHLQGVEEHPIFAPLKDFAVETIGLSTDRVLERFKQTLKLGDSWEPYAYVDLYEQARAGKLCHPSEQTVRQVQRKEFELLFCHCHEQATGEQLTSQSDAESPPPRKKPVAKPARRKNIRPPQTKSSNDQKSVEPRLPTLKKGPPRIGISCPKCQAVSILPESRRGSSERCAKCNTVFLVPQAAATAAGPSGTGQR